MENQGFDSSVFDTKNDYSSNSSNLSNPVTGLIGAVIGACLGVVAWVVIYKLGFIAAIGGIAIMAGAMKGYEILGGGIDIKGIILCVLVSIVMVFVANYLSWAVEWYDVLNEFETWSFSEVLPNVFEFNKTVGVQADFIKDLIMGYVLSVVGAASMVGNKIREAR